MDRNSNHPYSKYTSVHSRLLKETKMITIIEYVYLFALISFAGFISYTAHEVGNAIHSILHDDWGNYV
jgi:Flp pilus assembly pilin Flp